MRKTLMSCVGTAVLVLAGCSNQTPTCADAQTVSLVKQIYQQQFDKQHKDVGEERQKRVQFTVNDSTVKPISREPISAASRPSLPCSR